ncbi:MAG: chloride channel protein, partial [Bdellovibrionaceae bacterium]|nr:chloride channel protein [Pseudobdellovibrionaceae bacterium]
WIPLDPGLLGALGFAAVFAGAAHTPLACTLMAAEIFGLSITPYALLTCWLSHITAGTKGIYLSQKNRGKSPSGLIATLRNLIFKRRL